MEIVPFQSEEREKVIALLKQFYPIHAIFSRDEIFIAAYLEEQAKEHLFLLGKENGTIKACGFLVKKALDSQGHSLWKLRHAAFVDAQSAQRFLHEIETIVLEESATAKIECFLAATEPGKEWYFAAGYQEEGLLQNHYRWQESCFVLGKSLQRIS